MSQTKAQLIEGLNVNTSAPADSLVIDSSGNVGIGTTTVNANAILHTVGGNILAQGDGGANTASLILSPGSTPADGVQISVSYSGSGSYGPLNFITSSTEKMRISSEGWVATQSAIAAIGSFSASSTTDLRVSTATSVNNGGVAIESYADATTTRHHFSFSNSNGVVGSISTNASATAYNTSSDYRLKENVVPLTGAADRLNQLQVHRFNFIADPDKIVDGFLAHEAQAVVPECVTGTKDEVDDEGNPVYQGIDQSKLVPLLTAALQEALTEIESLKARVTALEP